MLLRTVLLIGIFASTLYSQSAEIDQAVLPPPLAADAQLTGMQDMVIDLRLDGNKQYSGCTITEFAEGEQAGSLKKLKVRLADSIKVKTIPVRKVVEVFYDGQPLDVAYEKSGRFIARNDVKREKRIASELEINKSLSRQDAQLWVPLSAAHQQEYMQRQWALLKLTRRLMPEVEFEYVETEYFMFLTNLSDREVSALSDKLDEMYSYLCNAFGIPPSQNIWCGKCVMLVFREEAQFLAFEKRKDNHDASGAQGVCTNVIDGRVYFSGYSGDGGLAHTIVHETTHGFIYRYLSNADVPSWLNEGMAEWMANEVVGGPELPLSQKMAADRVRVQGTIGDLFTNPQNIRGEDYGLASAFVGILTELYKQDKDKEMFKDFFDGIKTGKDTEESLRDSFGMSFLDLKILYAKMIGMPRIR